MNVPRTDEATVLRVFALFDAGENGTAIARALGITTSLIYTWRRNRVKIMEAYAARAKALGQKADEKSAWKRRKAAAVAAGQASRRVPPEVVAEIRALYAEVETIAPGIVARKTNVPTLAKQFRISESTMRDIVKWEGSYQEAT